eukprot:7755029-Ditylum_brightwellii.AAC.1
MDLLSQYNHLTLDDLKRHANQYHSGNPLATTFPAPSAMNVAVLDPANNADHRKCFYQRMVFSMIQKKIKNHTMTESWRRLEL